MQQDRITLENVGSRSTYEIRQELEKRGVTLPKTQNYSTLLQSLVKTLLNEQEIEEIKELEDIERRNIIKKQNMIQAKEERKKSYIQNKNVLSENNSQINNNNVKSK